MKKTISLMACTLALLLLVAGCGTESSLDPVQNVDVGLTVAFDLESPNGTIPGGEDIQTNTRPAGGPDSVTVNSGLLMLRTVRLHTSPVAPDSNITAADEDRDFSDASVRYHGPYIAQIGQSMLDLGDLNLPIGNHQQMTFVMQKARDTDDLGNNSELMGSSVRVEGKVWRGSVGHSFVFETDYTSEVAVRGSFTVNGNASDNLGIVFQAGHWFHNGSRWLDPNEPSDRSRIVSSMLRNISGGNGVL